MSVRDGEKDERIVPAFLLLKAGQTANLLQQEECSEPQPGIEAMLDRWDKVVEDFIDEPGVERMGPLKVCMRELVEFVW